MSCFKGLLITICQFIITNKMSILSSTVNNTILNSSICIS